VGDINVWDVETGNCLCSFNVNEGGIYFVALSHDDTHVASIACSNPNEGDNETPP